MSYYNCQGRTRKMERSTFMVDRLGLAPPVELKLDRYIAVLYWKVYV